MIDHTPAGRAFSALIVEIFRLNGRLLVEGDRLMQGLGLTSARWQVLGAIALAPTPETVARLARNMGLTRQSVQRLINEMAADGIVQLADNPHHARAKLVTMTEKGRALFKATFEVQAPWVNAVASGIDDRAIAAATELLVQLRERLEASRPDADA